MDAGEKRPNALIRRLGKISSDRTLDRTLAANQLDVGQQCPIEYIEVLERRICDRTRPVASDRALAVSDQWIMAPMVGTTGRVWSGRD